MSDEICDYCGGDMVDCQCRDEDDLLEDKVVKIKITDSISFESDLPKIELKAYLRDKMSIEDLGDCIFVKKLCKFPTFKIEFTDDSPLANITGVTQIRDEQNNRISKEMLS